MPVSVLFEAVEAEGFGGSGVVAPALGDKQVAGVFDGGDDGGADVGQVGGPAAERGLVVGSCRRSERARGLVTLRVCGSILVRLPYWCVVWSCRVSQWLVRRAGGRRG